MNRNIPAVPSFEPASKENDFLASKDRLYEYAHLYGFSKWLYEQTHKLEISVQRPLLLIARSSDELVFLMGGCFLLNLPFIPVDPMATPHEIETLLTSIHPGLVYGKSLLSQNIPSLNKLPELTIPAKILETEGEWDQQLFSLQKPDDVAGLFLTSGSTGSPKIVPVKRRQVYFAAKTSAENFKPDQNSYWLLNLPLNHIGGISIILRSLLYQSAIFRMQKFNEDQVRTFLSENKLFQVASMVPAMLTKLLNDPLFQVHRQFKALLLGGGPISLQLVNKAETRGIPIVLSYGMTETCAQVAANPLLKPSGIYCPKKSVGMIFPPNELQIKDTAGNKLPNNESGQIWLRGPQVFDGYLDSALNNDVFDTEGWFNTGDFGHVNRFKQLFVENRRTDRIVTGGENVDPVEVENALMSLSEISEAAVLGIEDNHWGQRVIAFIIPESQKKPGLDSIKKELASRLSAYKIPKEILVVESIPKTSIGKIKRSLLASIYHNKQSAK